MSTGVPSTEGTVPFTYHSLPALSSGQTYHTWYKVIGSLSTSSRPPLVALHGGPGATHDYFCNLSLLTAKHNVPVILYDQLGNGNSSRLPSTRLDTSVWTRNLFLAELENLLAHLGLGDSAEGKREYDLLGHSWGGVLGAMWAMRQPKALRKLVLNSSPASMAQFAAQCKVWIAQMPADAREAIEEGEREKDYEGEAYQTAVMEFYKLHLCRVWPFPEDLQKSLEALMNDDTVYRTM
jgi:proline-specific peptidase